ncbi:hypothetical protein GCM10007160_15280 [Litchfieldella qijiaojingensis]|uniref:FAD-binding domain-containing protein n=1 Tax=Litchfieldella qijiaojingensis TaxID=980347 RepID=A0ABQ2YM06_9GAMM|nr:hypothetical protein [Halomonas qijiaojingensis]GGX88741.1 hypothetical protein GCM10007160_15280 [Halomonas qijiaojingensis]
MVSASCEIACTTGDGGDVSDSYGCLGQGGNQALEDALELARALDDRAEDVTSALHLFEERRRDRVDPLVSASREKVELFRPATPHVLENWYDGMDDISAPSSMSVFDDIMQGQTARSKMPVGQALANNRTFMNDI